MLASVVEVGAVGAVHSDHCVFHAIAASYPDVGEFLCSSDLTCCQKRWIHSLAVCGCRVKQVSAKMGVLHKAHKGYSRLLPRAQDFRME